MPDPDKSQPQTSQQPRKPQPAGHPAPATPSIPLPQTEQRSTDHSRHMSAEGFLKQLLPKGLDTGDLLIGVLLLLMAGDCQEDKNTALLTLALYLFL